MSVFQKVTIQSLKKNRTRTIVTIIGIILSAAMICAVTTSVSSLKHYLSEYAIYNDGDWHGMVNDSTYDEYKEIKDSDQVEESFYGQVLGYAKIDSKNVYKPYLYVLGGDEGFFSHLPIHMIEGELPKDSTEILLPQHLEENGGVDYQIGDVITLGLGERMLDGYHLGQYNPCYEYDWVTGEDVSNGEELQVNQTRTYKVVGFYERPSFEEYSAAGYTALTVAEEETTSLRYDIYFKMEHPKEVYDFMESLQLEGTYNSDVLLYEGVSKYDTFSVMLTSFAVIIIGLIMFGSISLIYNAFAISVSERTKQFGLLSSLGATKRQLRQMVFFEAFVVSVIGIPVGVLSGILGIAVTLHFVGNKFISMLGGGFDQPMKICVSWESVIVAAVVALVTVFLSAWLPSKRATKVSAVEAIRQSADIKMEKRQVKTSKLTYRLFGLPGVLASKYYKRSKKKYRATVLSLFMSIVLFVSASAFSEYLMESVSGGMAVAGYDLWYTEAGVAGENIEDKEEFLELLTSEEHVTSGAYTEQHYFDGVIGDQYLTDAYRENEERRSSYVYSDIPIDIEKEKGIYGYFYFVDDTEFHKLLEEYGLDEGDYYNSVEPMGIAIDENVQFDGDTQRYVTIDTLKGDTYEITAYMEKDIEGYTYSGRYMDENGAYVYRYQSLENEEEYLDLNFEDSHESYVLRGRKVITEEPYYIPKIQTNLQMIYPFSRKEEVLQGVETKDSVDNTYYLKSDDHKASYDNLNKLLSENGYNADFLFDYGEDVESSRNVVIIIQVFSYGFIVLISMIAAANVFNTISTNINLRRREFAMLKSVGMTQKGFNKMMNFECLLYGSKALLYGLPVSAAVTYLIYRATDNGYETSYHLPWVAIGIAVISVFAVVFVTMLYSMSKMKKENTIDALKNENL